MAFEGCQDTINYQPPHFLVLDGLFETLMVNEELWSFYRKLTDLGSEGGWSSL